MDERTAATGGTRPSLMKESFLVRLPMMRFFSSLRALSCTSESGDVSRVRRSEWAPVVEGDDEREAETEAEAEEGIVVVGVVVVSVKEAIRVSCKWAPPGLRGKSARGERKREINGELWEKMRLERGREKVSLS